MRPPMQSAALQQNEAIKQQQQQQQHSIIELPNTHIRTTSVVVPQATAINKQETTAISKNQSHKNLGLPIVPPRNKQQQQHQQQTQQQQQLPTYHTQESQRREFFHRRQSIDFLQHHSTSLSVDDNFEEELIDADDSIQLVDLSTSPPNEITPTTTTVYSSFQQNETFHQQHHIAGTTTGTTTAATSGANLKRASIASDTQYSRSSSSDDGSYSYSAIIGGSSNGGLSSFLCGVAEKLPASSPPLNSVCVSRASTFDDAAENFVINFPGDSSPLLHQQNHLNDDNGDDDDCTINLPLSEKEPLLTNIEATIADTQQRSISLKKNSASLIFTKKLITHTPPAAAAATATTTVTPTASAKVRNNNFNSLKFNTIGSGSSSGVGKGGNINCDEKVTQPLLRQHHSSLRSASERNRKPSKHLPATYQQQQQQQQHRRSLQLNYNNNLVTTTACGANNNYCCSGNSSTLNKNESSGGGVVLHKLHSRSSALITTSTGASDIITPTAIASKITTTTTTAAATRKQHAYSWYAPVYSALEEELEQDSRDSSPIHNLAHTKKQHSSNHHHYQHRLHNFSTTTATTADNETESLLEAKNQINIQAQLHPRETNREQISGLISSGGSDNGGGEINGSPTVAVAGGTRKSHIVPNTLPLQLSNNNVGVGPKTVGGNDFNSFPVVVGNNATDNSYDTEGPHAGSLVLAGGPRAGRKRFENLIKFSKRLVGLSPSSGRNGSITGIPGNASGRSSIDYTQQQQTHHSQQQQQQQQLPASPEIKITRTPSEQEFILRNPAGRSQSPSFSKSGGGGGDGKLANGIGVGGLSVQGSTSSLNVVQQKLWNIMRRQGSATSLNQESMSQSIVQYKGLRKCETVLALTRQAHATNSLRSPMLSADMTSSMGNGMGASRGSGIFNANGVEQIRPLNRLRNSVISMNGTCSRCSSLLSLAATGSRYSLNITANGAPNGFVNTMPTSVSQHQITQMPQYHHQQQHTHLPQQQTQLQAHGALSSSSSNNNNNNLNNSRNCVNSISCNNANTSIGSATIAKSKSNSCKSPTAASASATASTSFAYVGNSSNLSNYSRKSSAGANSTHSASACSLSPPSNITTATLNSSCITPLKTTSPPTTPPITMIPTVTSITTATTTAHHLPNNNNNSILSTIINTDINAPKSTQKAPLSSPSPMTPIATAFLHPTGISIPTETTTFVVTKTKSTTNVERDVADSNTTSTSTSTAKKSSLKSQQQQQQQVKEEYHHPYHHSQQQQLGDITTSQITAEKPFEMFTCKLCLIDVETVDDATTLTQCGCQFCTECMKAYVEFEISEGAYEISCPDAQCPAQGIMILPEIALLTTTNLMKKHHRYRLNREIELDKTRTWCPRAGCETVCRVGPQFSSDPSAPTTSSAAMIAAQSLAAANYSADGIAQILCAVQCPSCKDEFCSACKKAWHPNISCEENSRRLVADGQDDIGIPFDNDLIKCCPMCAVPIEKDEGCAQMMCKRCKHVFCWYCLASLDDDFLLRHYDKGPCKNKLGHSRASVVWHRAQVIGIFAGFGILLLVASPLLLLAAPCIICCKCRSCSGSKIDEGDGDLDEATTLQS